MLTERSSRIIWGLNIALLRFGKVPLILVFALSLFPGLLYAQYYKCIGEDGVHIYTNTGCPIDAENQRFALPESNDEKKSKTATSVDKIKEHDTNNGHDNTGTVGLEIYTEGYRLSPDERTEIETGINFILGYYKQAFNYNEDVPVKIRIFGKKKSFLNYQRQLSPLVSKAGFYSQFHNEAVVNGERDKAEVLATIYHEANHAILIQKAPELPFWINEGLAEYFERIAPEDGSVTVGHQDARYVKMQEDLKADELPGLGDYIEAWDNPWERGKLDKPGDTRSIAWSLIHFLMSTQEGQDTVIYIMREKHKNPSLSSIEIIDKHYPGGLDKLETGWKSHIMQSPTLHVYAPFE